MQNLHRQPVNGCFAALFNAATTTTIHHEEQEEEEVDDADDEDDEGYRDVCWCCCGSVARVLLF